ncbi:MAG: 50S ribosomal protein L4 [Chloroflexota bacterium]|nr:50S ribosomal protein L4 [Chloroflexota bacterium]MDE2683769.1 50S ribosomal protein L4 [Chloroflexota bacterium]
MELPVVNGNGDAIDTININDGVFDVPMNQTLVHQAMVIYQLNQRQGTHSTRTRAEVSGGGRKPWIQKHTGRARQGSIRSPQWRHGGIVFGPKPRDYRKALPRAMRRKALQCVLSEKIRNGRLICIDSLGELDGRTKSMKRLLGNLGISGSVLVITEDADQDVVRAGSNLKQVWTLPSDLVNANDVLKRETVLVEVGGIRRIAELCTAPRFRARAAASAASGEEAQA